MVPSCQCDQMLEHKVAQNLSKAAQMLPLQFLLKSYVFQSSPKSHTYLGYFWRKKLSPRTFKISPIQSHCLLLCSNEKFAVLVKRFKDNLKDFASHFVFLEYSMQSFFISEFLPNYQEMMTNSLGAGKSSFGNFSQVTNSFHVISSVTR